MKAPEDTGYRENHREEFQQKKLPFTGQIFQILIIRLEKAS